jgi:hypothetical protein
MNAATAHAWKYSSASLPNTSFHAAVGLAGFLFIAAAAAGGTGLSNAFTAAGE